MASLQKKEAELDVEGKSSAHEVRLDALKCLPSQNLESALRVIGRKTTHY
jgi:hypothetical protein